MAKQIPYYGERVVKADSVLADMHEEYREEFGHPVHGNATRLNHVRGLIVAQVVEVDIVLKSVLHKIEPGILATRSWWTSGALYHQTKGKLSAAKGSSTAGHLKVIEDAVERRNMAAHGSLDVVVMVDRVPCPGFPDCPACSEDAACSERDLRGEQYEYAYLNGKGVTEADLIADLALQQDALRAAVQIWIDLHE